MLENTGMKAGRSSASTSSHKAVPTWCKGTKKEQQIWQRWLGETEKEQAWWQPSAFSLWHAWFLWLKTTPHFERPKQIKASYSASLCSLLMASPWGGQHTQVGKAPAEDPAPYIHSLCPRKDVTRQEGGQGCAQSKRRSSHVAEQADCAILNYFVSADFYFLSYYNWRLGNFFSCG